MSYDVDNEGRTRIVDSSRRHACFIYARLVVSLLSAAWHVGGSKELEAAHALNLCYLDVLPEPDCPHALMSEQPLPLVKRCDSCMNSL